MNLAHRNHSLKSAHPKQQMEVLIDHCGSEYQHQVLSEKEKQLSRNNIARLILSGVLLSFVVIQPLNSLAEWSWRFLKAPTFDPNGLETNFKELNADKGFNRTLKDGDSVLSHVVTSPFGMRKHPVTGETKMHYGIDLNTPKGTPIYAIGKPRNWSIGEIFSNETIYVQCADDPKGGTIADVTSSLLKDYKFTFMHLDSCNAGSYASGAIIGTTGNSGESTTREHLHFEVELKGQKIDPPVGFVLWALQGKEPQIQETKPIVERLRNAIAGQESNHNPSAVNPHSNALGYGQVMPENIKEWSTQCLGKPLTEKEFIESKEKQVKIIDCKLAEYLEITAKTAQNQDQQIRKVASMWYSGDPTLYDNPRPQTYGAGDYPSIREYTTTVLERFKKQ